MKKVFVLFLLVFSIIIANDVKAQTPKIGVFDLDMMARAMPGYPAVDSLVAIYEQDSLKAEYDFAVQEYNRLDSTYKADSAAKKSATILKYQQDQRMQIATTVVYWQQISQRKSAEKRQILANPLYDQILVAYKKVLDANNYLVILKPGAYEIGSRVDNVFEKVAKELKINLPNELKSPPAPPTQQAPPANRPKAGAKPPTGRKP
jgi:Skp family chaperone for outer membrane proteins